VSLIRTAIVAVFASSAALFGLVPGGGFQSPGLTDGPAPVTGPSAAADRGGVTQHADLGFLPVGSWSTADVDPQRPQFTSDQRDLTTLPVIHPVYLYAKDAPNRFLDYEPMFQALERRSSAVLGAAIGMAFRWDERIGSDQRIYHDITVLKSTKATFAQLSGNQQFKYASAELKAAGLNLPTKKYFVWVDAPSKYCGETTGVSDTTRAVTNAANGTTMSTAYRYYPVDTTTPEGLATGGFCAPILHELTHAMGAVLSVAPHAIGGGHCGDDPQDIMCNSTINGVHNDPNKPLQYDSGNDDYLDPAADPQSGSTAKLGWWTVNLSKFLCPRDPSRQQPDCAVANTPSY
jgi:hypothetical protein